MASPSHRCTFKKFLHFCSSEFSSFLFVCLRVQNFASIKKNRLSQYIIYLFLYISRPKLVCKFYLKFPVFEKVLLYLLNFFFHIHETIHNHEIHNSAHMLATMILHLTVNYVPVQYLPFQIPFWQNIGTVLIVL